MRVAWVLAGVAVVCTGLILQKPLGFSGLSGDRVKTETAVETTGICPLWADQSGPILRVELGISPDIAAQDVTLNIPETYIIPRDVDRYRSGKLDGAALLFARLPDFAPQTPAIQTDPLAPGADQRARILVTTFVDMDDILHSSITTWGRPAAGQEFPLRDMGQGLSEVDFPTYTTPSYEVFFAPQQGPVSDVILCDNRPENASCQHKFKAGAVDLELSYRRTNLPQWQQIKTAAQQLVGCLLVPSN